MEEMITIAFIGALPLSALLVVWLGKVIAGPHKQPRAR